MVHFKQITCLLLTQTFNINFKKQKPQKYSLELSNKICRPSSSNSWGIYILNIISCVYTTCQSWLENLSIKHNLYILLMLWLHANMKFATTAEKNEKWKCITFGNVSFLAPLAVLSLLKIKSIYKDMNEWIEIRCQKIPC